MAVVKNTWNKFRKEVIELDDFSCVRCPKSLRDNPPAQLHVHHKKYLPGRAYWDYPIELMETLCAGCHGKEHLILSPDCGWRLDGSYHNHGARISTCDYCGNSIRYSYHIKHPNWPAMDVGRGCCDRLTGTSEDSIEEAKVKKLMARRQRFIESDGWQQDYERDGVLSNFALDYRVRIEREPSGYRIFINSHKGTKLHSTISGAKGAVFDAIIWLQTENRVKRECERFNIGNGGTLGAKKL